MKRRGKQILSAILSAAIIMTSVPIHVFADERKDVVSEEREKETVEKETDEKEQSDLEESDEEESEPQSESEPEVEEKLEANEQTEEESEEDDLSEEESEEETQTESETETETETVTEEESYVSYDSLSQEELEKLAEENDYESIGTVYVDLEVPEENISVASMELEEEEVLKATSKQTIERYTVLILDASGSMSGTPERVQREAAVKFVDSILDDSAVENYLSIVEMTSTAATACNFTNDREALKRAVNRIYAYGGTGYSSALELSDRLLDNVVPKNTNSKIIKNIVLCSDGLPESGKTKSSGRYSNEPYVYSTPYANYAYEQAEEIKKKDRTIYTLGFFHTLSGSSLNLGTKLMRDIASEESNYYMIVDASELEFIFGQVAEKITNLVKTGEFTYAGKLTDHKATYYYKDDYFTVPATSTDKEKVSSLATMSLCLAMSAFGSYGDDGEHKSGWTDSEYTERDRNIKSLLSDLEFEHYEANKNYHKKPTNDSIGVCAALKKIYADNKDYTLIAVGVRGAGYEAEWASNVKLGKENGHTGFGEARDQVIKFLQDYVKENKEYIGENVKLWIVGYSRAAATTNLTAASLDQNKNLLSKDFDLTNKNIYAFCFECPMGVVGDPTVTKLVEYNNIKSVVNPVDPVTKVAPASYKFNRYGDDRTLALPSPAYDANYANQIKNMKEFYKSSKISSISDYEETSYQIDNFNYYGSDWLAKEQQYFDHFWSNIFTGNKTQEGALTQDVYGDLLLEKLCSSAGKRKTFYNNYQSGLNYMLGYIFSQKDAFGNFKEAIHWWDTLLIMDVVVDYLSDNAVQRLLYRPKYMLKITTILCDAFKNMGYSSYEYTKVYDFVDNDVFGLIVDFFNDHPIIFSNVIANAGKLGSAHYPELCLAWLMSRDSNYTEEGAKKFAESASSITARYIYINCPVDVTVFDENHKVLAQIVNEKMAQGAEYVSYGIDENGQKFVVLPGNAECTVEMDAYDDGNVSINVQERSLSYPLPVRNLNYYEIEVEKGEKLTLNVPEIEGDTDEKGSDEKYIVKNQQGDVIPVSSELSGEDVQLFTVTTSCDNEKGEVLGDNTVIDGTYCTVFATPAKDYEFVGWYEGEKLVSDETEFKFSVKKDTDLTAQFEKRKASDNHNSDNDNKDNTNDKKATDKENGKKKHKSDSSDKTTVTSLNSENQVEEVVVQPVEATAISPIVSIEPEVVPQSRTLPKQEKAVVEPETTEIVGKEIAEDSIEETVEEESSEEVIVEGETKAQTNDLVEIEDEDSAKDASSIENMQKKGTVLWLWIGIAIAICGVASVVYFKKKNK